MGYFSTLAIELLEGTPDRELIDIALNSYQKKKVLSMEELCSIGIFLKISIISNIRKLCEKIRI